MERRIFWIAFAGLLIFHTGLLLTPRIFPLIDLPYHLAAATIFRSYGEPDNAFDEFYRIDVLPNPNIAHVLFCGSGWLGDVESANRIYLILCSVLLPVAVWLLIRAWNGDPWFALLSFPFIYHYSFSWGFVGFTLAVPFVLIGILFLTRHRQNPTSGRRLLLAAWLLLLYAMHLLAALFFSWLLVLHLIRPPRSNAPRQTSRRVSDWLILVPLAALIAFWQLRADTAKGPGLASELWIDYTRHYLPDFPRRIAFFVWDNFALMPGVAGYAVAAFFSVAVVVTALAAAVRGRIRSSDRAADTGLATRFLLAALAAYVFLPWQVPGTAHLYERFSVIALLALIVWAARRRPFASSVGFRFCAIVICLLHAVLWADYQVGFRRETANFDGRIFPQDKPDVVLGAFVFDYTYRGRPVYNHFPDYYTVWKHGITVSKVGDYRFYPIRRRAAIERLPVYNEWVGKWGGYDGRYSRLDYLLVRGSPPPEMRRVLDGFQRERAAGPWNLYARGS